MRIWQRCQVSFCASHLHGALPEYALLTGQYKRGRSAANNSVHLAPRSYATFPMSLGTQEGSDSEEERDPNDPHAHPTRSAIFRTPRPTQADYEERLVPKYNRGRWEPAEDQALLAAVERFGTGDWSQVMMGVKGRTALQCADRYKGYLSPEHRRGMWTKEVSIAVCGDEVVSLMEFLS